jgi:predicted amidophosphoribosyltransferase
MTQYDRYRLEHQIESLYSYHKQFIGRPSSPNPKHKGKSEKILDVKKKNTVAIKSMATKLEKKLAIRLDEFDVICSMPSSNADESRNGIRMTASKLARNLGIIDASGCLIRTTTKPKSCAGSRSIELQRATLAIENHDLIIGKKVLLLDDVTTSGRSLVAGAEILEKSGASSVLKYALGETVYYG